MIAGWKSGHQSSLFVLSKRCSPLSTKDSNGGYILKKPRLAMVGKSEISSQSMDFG
jgi:hypothetical protein